MTHGSLFSGIGGFDLAAEWMGWENVFQVEKDEWLRKLLKQNFPYTTQFDDHENWQDLPEPTISGGNNGVSDRVDRTKG